MASHLELLKCKCGAHLTYGRCSEGCTNIDRFLDKHMIAVLIITFVIAGVLTSG